MTSVYQNILKVRAEKFTEKYNTQFNSRFDSIDTIMIYLVETESMFNKLSHDNLNLKGFLNEFFQTLEEEIVCILETLQENKKIK